MKSGRSDAAAFCVCRNCESEGSTDMPRRPLWKLATLLLAVMLPAGALVSPMAAATALRDPQTGLSVTPPAGFVARPLPAPPAVYRSASMRIEQIADPARGCDVTAQMLPNGGDIALGRVFAHATGRAGDWRTKAWAIAAETLRIDVREPFERNGVAGLLLEGASKAAVSRGEQPIRVRKTILQTSAGTTVITCSAPAETFPATRSLFDAIAAGVEPPR
jgi:hypothetical protein